MRLGLLIVFTAQLFSTAFAQEQMAGSLAAHGPRLALILDVPGSAGQVEAFFQAKFDSCLVAAIHAGPDYDLTYNLGSTGLLTVQFYEGKAGFFRLVMRQAQASAEELPSLLGIDPADLQLVREMDVIKVWRGAVGGVVLKEVSAIVGPAGWTTAVVKVAGYPHERTAAAALW